MDALKDAAKSISNMIPGPPEGSNAKLPQNESSNPRDASGSEPIAGAQGSGTLDSPFDQGNVTGQGQSGTTGDGQEPDANAPTTSKVPGDLAGSDKGEGRGGGGW